MSRIIIINNKGGCGKSTLAVALAEVLGAEIVDLDNQKTITTASELTGRHKPVKMGEEGGGHVVFDTPPYRDVTLKGLMDSADVILIPMLVGYPDLLATKAIVKDIIAKKMANKTTIVLSKVRKPLNKSYFEIKKFIQKNYSHIDISSVEIPETRGFQDVLARDLGTKEKQVIKELIKELKIQ